MIVSTVCFQLSAKTFTIKVSDPNAGYVINPANSSRMQFDADNKCEVDFDDSVILYTGAYTGYEIVSILDGNGSAVGTPISSPVSSASINVSDVAENSTVTITFGEKESVYVTFIGDPEQMYIQYNYAEIQPEGNEWKIKLDYSSSIYVYARSGCTIVSIKDEAGSEVSHNGSYAYVYCEEGIAKTFTVETADAGSSRTASFTMNIDGDPADVTLTRTSDWSYITFSDESTEVKFNPSSETGYQIRHTDYNKSLYKVEKNGVELTKSPYGSSYEFTVEDGDVITAYTQYPDLNSTVKFNFVNEGTTGVVSSITLDNATVPGWIDGFTAKFGQKLRIGFNTSDYNITSIKVNGTPLTSFYSYDTTIMEETIVFDIEATARPPKSVTIITDVPEALSLYTGYNKSGICYTFSEEETVIEVPNSAYSLYTSVTDDYKIAAVEINGIAQSYFTSIYINDGDVVVIALEPIERNKRFALYFEDSELWSQATLTLASNNYDLRREYSFYSSLTTNSLAFGYTQYVFGDMDIPAEFNSYRKDWSYDMVVYRNGEELTGNYGGYTFDTLEDGDVIKAYASAPETYTVTYDNPEGAEVEIRHDIITTIDNPSVHNVLAGTTIHILAVAPAAEADDNSDSKISVSVNGTELTPDENGVFTTDIHEDSAVTIAKTSTGIMEIEAGQASGVRVYNLQGIYVGDTTESLPSGVYIVNGVKVRL